jgi:hypothetical protein
MSEIELVVIAAAGIKSGITIWASIAAHHVLRDAQLMSAGAATAGSFHSSRGQI